MSSKTDKAAAAAKAAAAKTQSKDPRRSADPLTTQPAATAAATNDNSQHAASMALSQGPAEGSASRRRAADIEPDPLVTVNVPTYFRLQTAPGILVDYHPGLQEMPQSHAEHEYTKLNGVEVYKPKKGSAE